MLQMLYLLTGDRKGFPQSIMAVALFQGSVYKHVQLLAHYQGNEIICENGEHFYSITVLWQ